MELVGLFGWRHWWLWGACDISLGQLRGPHPNTGAILVFPLWSELTAEETGPLGHCGFTTPPNTTSGRATDCLWWRNNYLCRKGNIIFHAVCEWVIVRVYNLWRNESQMRVAGIGLSEGWFGWGWGCGGVLFELVYGQWNESSLLRCEGPKQPEGPFILSLPERHIYIFQTSN